MKKTWSILALAMTAFISTSTFAGIKFIKENITNDKKVFVQSLIDGKLIYAVNVGNYAVIPPETLKGYPVSANFTVGVNNGVTVQYCTVSSSSKTQFAFTTKSVTDSVVHIQGNGSQPPICKYIT